MFGNKIDPEAFILEVLSDLPKLDSVDGRLVLQDLYETKYGIYNHLDKTLQRPLASVAMFPSEDYNTDSLLEETMRSYVRKCIHENFKISYIEFMELPIDIVEMMVKISDEVSAKKDDINKDIEKEMKKQ